MKRLYLLIFLPFILTGCSLIPSNEEVSNNPPLLNESVELDNQKILEEPLAVIGAKECVTSYFKLNYPATWTNCQEPVSSTIIFTTDHPKYKLDIELMLVRIIQARYDELAALAVNSTKLMNANGDFLEYPEEGSLLSGALILEGINYDVSFKAKSDELDAARINEIWVPGHEVQKAILMDIIKSVQATQ